MNKKIVLILGVLLIFVIGAGGFYVMKKSGSKNNNPQSATSAKTTVTPANTTTFGTLKDLLSGGKSVKCTFSNKTEGVSVDGTVYAAGGKMRGDFKTVASKTTVNGHIIVDSSNSYFWTDMSNQGFKMAVTGESVNPSLENKSLDINQKLNYSCENWSKDNSVFALPSNITFKTLTVPTVSQGQSGGNSTGGATTNQCAACDGIPAGSARDACRTQLNCK